jgi:hypothetical protein
MELFWAVSELTEAEFDDLLPLSREVVEVVTWGVSCWVPVV